MAWCPRPPRHPSTICRSTGSLPITITGLGTARIAAAIRLPDALTLAAYSGGPVTATQTFKGEYPALAPPGTAPAPTCGSMCFGSARIAPLAPIGLRGVGGGPRARVADAYPCTLQIPPNLPIHLTFPSAFLGGLPVTNGYLDYDPSTGALDGGAMFSIGGASVSGFFRFVHGSFNGAGGCASGLDVPIIPELLQLDGISFDTFLDPTRFNATATLGLVGLGSGGSVIDVQGGTMAVFATGSHNYTYNQDKSITGQDDIPGTDSILYGQPFSTTAIGIGGQYSPFGLPLTVKGYALYVFPGYVEFGGSWGVNVLGGALTASLSGTGQLWMPQGEFDIQANGNFNVAGFSGSVGIVLSSKGIIGCGNVNIPDPPPISGTLATLSEGAGYHWGQGLGGVNIWLFGGCSNNYGSYQVNASSSALDNGSRSFTIRPGVADAMVRLAGSAGSPEVRVTGPGGEAASTGPGTQLTGGRIGRRVIALARMPQLDRTWIGLQHPAAGRWTVTPLPGSPPITSLAVADGLGPAVVRGDRDRARIRPRARLLGPAAAGPDRPVRRVGSGCKPLDRHRPRLAWDTALHARDRTGRPPFDPRNRLDGRASHRANRGRPLPRARPAGRCGSARVGGPAGSRSARRPLEPGR